MCYVHRRNICIRTHGASTFPFQQPKLHPNWWCLDKYGFRIFTLLGVSLGLESQVAWVSWKGSMIFGTQNKQKSMSRMSFVSTVNNKQKLHPKSQSELLSWCHPNKKRNLPTNGCDSYCISYCGGTCKCTRPLGAPSEHRIILLKSDTSLRPFVDDNDWSSSCFQLVHHENFEKNPCLSDSNPFVISKLKGGTSTSTTKSPTLGIHLPSNLPSSTWPSPSREDPLAFEVVWFSIPLIFHCAYFSHWHATPSNIKLRQV